MENLSAADLFEFQVLQKSSAIVKGLQEQIKNSDETVEQTKSGAVESRRKAHKKREGSQKLYAEKRKKARIAEAEKENNSRLAEYRTEKLLTATVNDGRQTSGVLCAMVQILGMQSGLTPAQIQTALGASAVPKSPLPDPPLPDLIVISDGEQEEEEDVNENREGGEDGDGADAEDESDSE